MSEEHEKIYPNYFFVDCDKSWKQDYVSKLLAMSNKDLFEEMLRAHKPDQWDGVFSDKGAWQAKKSKDILIKKLQDINFI